jgi:CubicO group peptidase (beta-lactamase class C family)
VLNVHALEARIDRELAEARVPGFAIALLRGGEVVYARGFGVTATDDGGRAVTPATLFRVGSVTKAMTGTAVMRLVADGKLALDTPVREYVPWFRLSDAAATEAVTLRMLLSHTAGLPHDHKPYGPRDAAALERRVREEVPAYPLVAPPGARWSYSNTGIHVAAFVAESVTGKTFPELMRELLFEPLGMARTTFDPTVAMTYPLAQSHDLGEDGQLSVRRRYADNAANYASGQAISTVLDLARFAQLHLRRGEGLLPAELVEEMHRPHASRPAPGASSHPPALDRAVAGAPPRGAEPAPPPASGAYGLTFAIGERNGARRVGHGGGITEFGASFDMAPDRGAAVITLRNRLAPELAVGRLVDDLFGELLA